MGDDDTLHANFVCFADKRNALFRRSMSGGKDDVRLGTYFHYLDHLRQDLSVIVLHRNAFLLSSFTLILVGGIQCRHPDAAAQDPGTKLIYAIGAVVGLIGGIKVYGKFSSDDPDTSKTAASWFGACIFLIVSATILRSFFL